MKHLFLISVSVLLLVTASAKLISATSAVPILRSPDPVVGIPNRVLLIGVALLESLVAFYVLFGKKSHVIKSSLILWLCTGFIIYRIGFWWIKPGELCPCLGTLSDRLPLKPETINSLMVALIFYFGIGASLLLVSEYSAGKKIRKLQPAGGS